LSAHADKTTVGQIVLRSIDQALDLIRYKSQIFAIGCPVDIDYRQDIVVILDRGSRSARYRSDVS
jgi:hypothetical protein